MRQACASCDSPAAKQPSLVSVLPTSTANNIVQNAIEQPGGQNLFRSCAQVAPAGTSPQYGQGVGLRAEGASAGDVVDGDRVEPFTHHLLARVGFVIFR